MPETINNQAIIKGLYGFLDDLGLRQSREKFYLEDAGHRGFSVDVGSSYGEVLVRVENNGVQVERLSITKTAHLDDVRDVLALLVAAKKAGK